MKRIYLIDCPGVVPPNMSDTEEDILLRGVVRVENVENPEQYVAAALKKCKKHHVERTYDLHGWDDHIQFLDMLARKGGRLLKGGEADLDGVAKMVLNDFLRGKIPWFTAPPTTEDFKEGIEGRNGKLGEMAKKRKRDDKDDAETETDGGVAVPAEDDFSGFSDEDDEDEKDDDEDDKTEGPSEEG